MLGCGRDFETVLFGKLFNVTARVRVAKARPQRYLLVPAGCFDRKPRLDMADMRRLVRSRTALPRSAACREHCRGPAIFRSLPGLLDAGKFRPWAFRIARDRIYREYRRRKLPVQPLDDSSLDELPDADAGVRAVDVEELHHCLGAVSPEHREALVLRFFEDMSYEDIARVTGASMGTVRSRIFYGKRALRAAWEGKTS